MWHPRRFIYVQSVIDEFWESLGDREQPKIKPAVDISQELHQLAENSFSRDRSQARCLQIVISSVGRGKNNTYFIRPKEVDKLESKLSHLEGARQ